MRVSGFVFFKFVTFKSSKVQMFSDITSTLYMLFDNCAALFVI